MESKNIKLPAASGTFRKHMLAVEPVRAQVLQVVGDASRLGVVVQVVGTRAVLKCKVAVSSKAFAETLRHKSHKSHKCEQIVVLRVVDYDPPDLIVELEPGAKTDCEAEHKQLHIAEPVEAVERRRAFLAPLATC